LSRTAPPFIPQLYCDTGFAGKDFENFITGELEAELVWSDPIRPDRKDEKPRLGKLSRIRQWVESVFDTMIGQLILEDHGGRTIPGVNPDELTVVRAELEAFVDDGFASPPRSDQREFLGRFSALRDRSGDALVDGTNRRVLGL